MELGGLRVGSQLCEGRVVGSLPEGTPAGAGRGGSGGCDSGLESSLSLGPWGHGGARPGSLWPVGPEKRWLWTPAAAASCLGRRRRPGRASWEPGEAGAEGRARGPLREAGSVPCPAEAVRPPRRVDSGPGGMGTGRRRVPHGASFREAGPAPPPPAARRPGGARVRTQRIRAGGRRPPRRGPGAGRGGRRGGSAARGLGAARRDPRVGAGRARGAGRGRGPGGGRGSDVGGPPGAVGPGPGGRLSTWKRAPGSLGPLEGRLLSPRRREVAAGGVSAGRRGRRQRAGQAGPPGCVPGPLGLPLGPAGSAPLPARSPAVWTRLQTRLLEGPLLRADSPRDGLARGPFPQRAWAPRAGGFEAQEGLWGQTEPPPTPQATSPAAAFEW